ncbi:MAG: SGNH/GDSL hydrolase family protein [Prochlorococcaceae cyanobacterium]
MTTAFAFLGDSTLDFGNLSEAASFLGERSPFRQKRYAGGGNVKASDGFVLGEQVVRQLGAGSRRSPDRLRSAELINLSDQPLRQGLRGTDPNAEVFNFAYAGATSGRRGSGIAGLKKFEIGLRQQASTLASASRFLPRGSDLDVIVSAGSNDIFDFLESNRDSITRVLITPGQSDNQRLANNVANRIVSNIDASLDAITGIYDEAAVIGPVPLSDIPIIRSLSNDFKDKVPLLGGSLSSEFRSFVNQISASVNQRLDRQYNSNDRDGVFAVNGIDAWKSVKSPSFVDSIHPDSGTNGRLASNVVSQIANAAGFDSFGL